MNKIRILQFNNTLSKSSGVMSVIMNYYRNIDRKMIQFDFIYFEDSDNSYETEIKKLGGKVFKILKPNFSINFRDYLDNLMGEINKESYYKTIHIHTPYLAFLISKSFENNGITNIICHSHATTYSDHLKGKIRNFFIKKFFMKRYFTHYMTCSIAASNFLFGKQSYLKGNVYLLNNAIDLEGFSYNASLNDKYRKELNLENKIILGNIGRLEKQKNQLFLLKVFKKLIERTTLNYHLLIVGDGKLKDDLVNYINSNKMNDKVTLLGFRDDVRYLYNIIDIFLLPSLFEGLPVVALEAQANGIPIILSNKITTEVGLLKFSYLSIKNKNKWVNEIINSNINSLKVEDKIKLEGYDIKKESEKLLDYYIKIEDGDFK